MRDSTERSQFQQQADASDLEDEHHPQLLSQLSPVQPTSRLLGRQVEVLKVAQQESESEQASPAQYPLFAVPRKAFQFNPALDNFEEALDLLSPLTHPRQMNTAHFLVKHDEALFGLVIPAGQ